jgi:hypothetical protein
MLARLGIETASSKTKAIRLLMPGFYPGMKELRQSERGRIAQATYAAVISSYIRSNGSLPDYRSPGCRNTGASSAGPLERRRVGVCVVREAVRSSTRSGTGSRPTRASVCRVAGT